ncbi:hypothetical protein [Niveispirillum irakense]|uniref:hypothetical protein n=1 Tax=Niveispirillum irakense TaxID=34011 RepID=UPI00042725C9|nr:hypothetical protein [Niveispirillum irakense]
MPRYGDMTELMLSLPGWLSMLIMVLAVTWTVCMLGIALGKTGRNPLWALVIFVFPPLLAAGLWFVAVSRWPRPEKDPQAK